jgi:hypothetical protein
LPRRTRCAGAATGGQAEGEVIAEITSDTEAAGRTVRASPERPRYLVRSEKSGGAAVHKPEALEKSGGAAMNKPEALEKR